jgi:hypothetical protein
MKRNAIILTSGLSGSSVLTGLIARAGYWTGHSTHKKRDYDTFENTRLIDLNLKLFQMAAYTGNYLVEFSSQAINDITSLTSRVSDGAFEGFIDTCNQHQPWVWKDPRLWLTIRFWKHLLDLNDCRFILLTRSTLQTWISQILRRQIISYQYSKNYETRIHQSILGFFEQNRVSYLHLSYEHLILRPADTVKALNRLLETELTIEDLKEVYHKPLYKNPRSSWAEHLKAVAIYAKNYSGRSDRYGTDVDARH